MNNGVKQAGFAQAPSPQAAMRPSPRNDTADTAFGDVMRSGEKGSRRSDGTSAAEQRWPGVDGKFALGPTMLGQAWHNAASTDAEPVTEDALPDENPELESGALTHRKSFRTSLELHTKESAESEPEADSKKHDEKADAGLALAIVEIDRAVDQKNSTAMNAGEETLASAVGVADQAVRKPAPKNDRPMEAAADEAAVSGDAEGPAQPAKNGRTAIEDASPSPRHSPLESEGQQRSDTQSRRAPIEPPGEPVRQAPREARNGEQPAANSRVDVVGSQMLPAPTATTNAFMSAISADPIWKTSAADAVTHTALHGRPQPGTVHSLKIQLHPAELGMVTADLRFTGDQLSVVLQVETAEAYHRLNGDTDTIVKAFRALGYEIDQVAIQQPQPVSQTSRVDAAASNSTPLSRDLQSAFSGNSGGAGAGSDGRGTHGEGRSDARNADSIGSISQERPSRGLYI